MKRRKLIITFLLINSLLLCSCGDKTEGEPQQTGEVYSEDYVEETGLETGNPESVESTEETTEEVIGEMPVITIKETVDNERFKIDFLEFSLSEETRDIRDMNKGLDNFKLAYDIMSKNPDESRGIECKTYTFTNHKYATAIINWKETPSENSDGDIYSYVYNAATQRYYKLERLLYDRNIKKEDIANKFKEYYENDEISVVSADTQAFRITSAEKLELYVNVKFSDSSSRIYIYTPHNEVFIPYSEEYIKSAQLFESVTSLAEIPNSSRTFKVSGVEYTEKELVMAANQKYVEIYNTIGHLFGSKGAYGTYAMDKGGKKYYKSEMEGLRTYDEAMERLKELFLMPESYFGSQISDTLLKHSDGNLWIAAENNDDICLKTGITEIESVMDSLIVFKTTSEMQDGTAISDYFTLIRTTDGDFKCTYFSYPNSELYSETDSVETGVAEEGTGLETE